MQCFKVIKKWLEKYFPIIPVEEQIKMMINSGVLREDIYHESTSMHTRQNALYSLKAIKALFELLENPSSEVTFLVDNPKVHEITKSTVIEVEM